MPNKKCAYCQSPMNLVIWGMPSAEEMENRKPLTEYTGCIIEPFTPKWRCEVCSSKIIPDLHPKSGICLKEAPAEVRKGINSFVNRISVFAGDDEPLSELIDVRCPGLDPEQFLDREVVVHKDHGDYLQISICNCQTLLLFFDGFGLSELTVFESLYHGDLEEREELSEFRFEPLAVSSGRLADIVFGNFAFSELIDIIGEAVAVGCQRDFVCESSRNWEMIADYWAHREEMFPDFWLVRKGGRDE